MTPIVLTNDQFFGALCVWREARGESLDGKKAVYAALCNRMNDPRNRWPKSLVGVVFQPWQFSSFNATDPNSKTFPSPRNPADWSAWEDCVCVVGQVLFDPTNGANHYFDCSIPPPVVAWLGANATQADLDAKQTLAVGRLKFYKL